MVEIHAILESDEMHDVVTAIEALRRKFSTFSSPADRAWPVALSLAGRYRANQVIKILLDSEVYYPGYKEVIAAAFGGWLLAPRASVLRRGLMIQAAIDFMDRAEASTGWDTALTLQKDIASRYIITGTDFLIEVYDCLGGYQAFSEAPSFDELWDGIDVVERPINTAARALAYLHHAINHCDRAGQQFCPSLNKAIAVLDELKNPKRRYPYKEKYVSRSLLHQRWSQNKSTLALLYAASTIRVNRKTLLRLILDGFFSYRDHADYLHLWIGRARYVATHIFARMEDYELQRETNQLLGAGETIVFQPPKLDEAEVESINLNFRININHKKPSVARIKNS